MGLSAGLKIVRGAYIEEERRLALKNGYPSPCWDTQQETHDCYDENISFLLDNFDKKRDAIVIASHNVKSCQKAAETIVEKGLMECPIIFGQLKAFSDSLTFDLKDKVSALF